MLCVLVQHIKNIHLFLIGVVPLIQAAFGMGTGMIVEQVRCSGTERRLEDCVIRDITDGECNHNEDAAVRCCKYCKST